LRSTVHRNTCTTPGPGATFCCVTTAVRLFAGAPENDRTTVNGLPPHHGDATDKSDAVAMVPPEIKPIVDSGPDEP